MNRAQRAAAGIHGEIENGLDDVRHTYEKAMWGERQTVDVNMFTPDMMEEKYNLQEQEQPDQSGMDID
jgi:hypothetical protein